jgi:hypothetical protein
MEQFYSNMESFLVYFRYFAQNFEWLEEQLDDIDDDYVIFDCPGKNIFMLRT